MAKVRKKTNRFSSKRRRNTNPKADPLSSHTDKELLNLRFCDLKLNISGSFLETCIRKLHAELKSKNLRITPHFWLSDDWFTPEGSTGIAVPFYLANSRLMRLERSQMGEVEGGTRESCMKFLRHEAGHVLDHSFRLHLRRKRQRLFGLSSHRYPRFYRPNPYSKRHVQHLQYWYAQSHPDEDFAETFAVWLQPRSRWRQRYQGWPALKKLVYMDELMSQLAGKIPSIKTTERVDTLSTLRKTLREHYQRKLNGYDFEYPRFYDADLKQLFMNKRTKNGQAASAFIRRIQPEVVRMVSPWTGEHRYVVDLVLQEMIGRCRELKLYVPNSMHKTQINFAITLTKHVVSSLYRHRRLLEM